MVAPARSSDLPVSQKIICLHAASRVRGRFSRPSALSRLASCGALSTRCLSRSASLMPYFLSSSLFSSSTRHCSSRNPHASSLLQSCLTRSGKSYLGGVGRRENSANHRRRFCHSPTSSALSLTIATSVYLRRTALARRSASDGARKQRPGAPRADRRRLQPLERLRAEEVTHVLEEHQLGRLARHAQRQKRRRRPAGRPHRDTARHRRRGHSLRSVESAGGRQHTLVRGRSPLGRGKARAPALKSSIKSAGERSPQRSAGVGERQPHPHAHPTHASAAALATAPSRAHAPSHVRARPRAQAAPPPR